MINFRRKKREGYLTPVEHAFRKIEPGIEHLSGHGCGRTAHVDRPPDGIRRPQPSGSGTGPTGELWPSPLRGRRRRQTFQKFPAQDVFFPDGWQARPYPKGARISYPAGFRESTGIFFPEGSISTRRSCRSPLPTTRAIAAWAWRWDVARYAMEKASIVIGEVHPDMPFTFGDTLVHMDEFDCLVESNHGPICLDRWPYAPVHEKVAENIASLIGDGSCLSFSTGPLFEASGQKADGQARIGDSFADLHRRPHGPGPQRCGDQPEQGCVSRQVPDFIRHGVPGAVPVAGSKSAGGVPRNRTGISPVVHREKPRFHGGASGAQGGPYRKNRPSHGKEKCRGRTRRGH